LGDPSTSSLYHLNSKFLSHKLLPTPYIYTSLSSKNELQPNPKCLRLRPKETTTTTHYKLQSTTTSTTPPYDHNSFESQSNPFGFEELLPPTSSQGGPHNHNHTLSAELDNFYLKLSDLADLGEIDETDPVALAKFHQEAAQVFAEGVLINIKLANFFSRTRRP
jgi:hypothetical protein